MFVLVKVVQIGILAFLVRLVLTYYVALVISCFTVRLTKQ